MERDFKNDEWYYDLCKTVAKNSKCLSRKIGAIIVMDKSVISQGYNGPPRGLVHCSHRHFYDEELRIELKEKDVDVLNPLDKCPRYALGYKSGEGLDLCVAGHAERNALINAVRNNVPIKGGTMYMDCRVPCTPCLVEIINSGISEIVFTDLVYYDRSAEYILRNSHLKWRVFSNLCKHEHVVGGYCKNCKQDNVGVTYYD